MIAATSAPAHPLVAHVVLSLDVGGAEMLVVRMVRSLRRSEFRPHVVCLDREGALAAGLRADGVGVTCVSRRPGVLDPVALWRLRRFLKEAGASLLHTHDLDAFAYGGLAAWLAGGRPVIHTQHGLPDPFGRLQRWKVRALRRTGRRFVGVSDEVTALGLKARWFVPGRTSTITNGVDVDVFRPDPKRRRDMRQQLGIPADRLVVISVARLAPVKDHQTLVRGFAASAAAHGGHLLLVGDGPERGRIEAEIGRLDMARQIRLLGPRTDVGDLLAAADVFALTSRSEGIALSLLEAMACGLVPVVTAVGGNTQVVRPEGTPNGILIAPGAPDALADALGRLAAAPDLRRRLGHAARATVCGAFSYDAMMDRYLALYRS